MPPPRGSQFPTEEDPPLDPVLVELGAVVEPVADPLLVLVEPPDVVLLVEVLPVLVVWLVAGAEVVVHDGSAVTVGLVVGVAVDPVVCVDVEVGVDASVAVWLEVDDADDVVVEVSVDPGSDGVEHAPLAAVLVPVVDVPVSEVALDFEELIRADAPLDGLRPAPPALGLW